MIHTELYKTVWLSKTFDFAHGYGWHCQYYLKNAGGRCLGIGYGFSKNKFTAYRESVKDANENRY